jgi:hypothetical protein
MTNKEMQICKEKILKCFTEDFKGNQAIFNKEEGWQVFGGTDFIMIMNKVVKGLKFAQTEIEQNLRSKDAKITKLNNDGTVSEIKDIDNWEVKMTKLWALQFDVFSGLGWVEAGQCSDDEAEQKKEKAELDLPNIKFTIGKRKPVRVELTSEEYLQALENCKYKIDQLIESEMAKRIMDVM